MIPARTLCFIATTFDLEDQIEGSHDLSRTAKDSMDLLANPERHDNAPITE
jgi:hypothetical protein